MRFFILLFLLRASLVAAPTDNCPFSMRDTLPSRSHYRTTPKINVITGECLEEECDLVVAGAEPLTLRRFYSQYNNYRPGYNFWRFNPEHCCAANFEWKNDTKFIAVGDANGNISSFEKNFGGGFSFNQSKQPGFTHAGQNGQTHPANTKITYWKGHQYRDTFRWEGEIVDGRGSKKTFCTNFHDWLSPIMLYERPRIREGLHIIEPDAWTPYFLPICEERLPNGNILCYTYKNYYPKEDYPSHYLLTSITAYNASRTKKLGSLRFDYIYQNSNIDSLMGIEVVGSDGRKACFHYGYTDIHTWTSYGDLKYLSSVSSPNNPPITYYPACIAKTRHKKSMKGSRIRQVARPDRHRYNTDYYENGQARGRYAPLGPNGELVQTHLYVYHKGGTNVFEAENIQAVYRYDSNNRITAIESYEDSKLLRIEKNTWDANGNLRKQTIEDPLGNCFLCVEYEYDKNHNVIEQKIYNDQGADVFSSTYSDDGFNLKLTESNRKGKLTCYAYVTGTNLLSSELVFDNEKIRKRAFHFYDDCAIRVKTLVDDGSTQNPYNLTNVTCRQIIEVKPKQSIPCFGLPEEVQTKTIDSCGNEVLLKRVCFTYHPSGQVEREDHYDANNLFRYSIYNDYDAKECLVATTDPLGHRCTFEYDNNCNLIAKNGPRSSMRKEWIYDFVNRPIQESEESIITKKVYDCLGRVICFTDACGVETHFAYDGLSRLTTISYSDGEIERKEYDLLGNVIKEINPKGEITRKEYNFRGQPTAIYYPDNTSEYFSYNEHGGMLTEHIDQNGIKEKYYYDIFDHLIKAETLSSSEELLKVATATYSPFHKLSETNAEGITTFFNYDFAGRKISEKTQEREIYYAYDALGRLYHTKQGDTVFIEERDLKDRLIEKRVEDSAGCVIFKENYAYDEANNLSHTITCQGTAQTLYNSQNLPIQHITADGHSTQISYDYSGHFSKTTIDPKGVANIEFHDPRGRLKEVQVKDLAGNLLQHRAFEYDSTGNHIKSTDWVYEGTNLLKMLTHTWEYGPNSRLERQLEAGSKEMRYLYDLKGRLETVIKPDGTELIYAYDDLARLSRFTSSHQDFDYNYTYDKSDRILEVFDPICHSTTKRTYDSYGNLLLEKLSNDLVLKSTYNMYGNRTAILYPDETQANFFYQAGQLKKVTLNGDSYTYHRNLAGKVTQAGFQSIEYDNCLRWKETHAPSFSALYRYDSRGHLTDCAFTDALGKKEEMFDYDDLNQLTSENAHCYHYDSHYNRRSKDNLEHEINDLSQVISDGQREYAYDPNGNLIKAGATTFIYDSLDRLIEVKKEKERYHYRYDPFNRRVTKITPQETVNYYWDGNHEVGSTRKELRVLGEGLGAELGAAVFISINNEIYTPIHDHRGALIGLLDKQGVAKETIRYTAYGEELTNKQLSPWRFASKRFDEETGYIYFGRRYYSPLLGRWITTDPNGFEDGPNLYAYVHNSPLTNIDCYGLWSWGSFCDSAKLFGKSACDYLYQMGCGIGNCLLSAGESMRADFQLEYQRDSTLSIEKSQRSYENWKTFSNSLNNDPLGTLMPGLMEALRTPSDADLDEKIEAWGKGVVDIGLLALSFGKSFQVAANAGRGTRALSRLGCIGEEVAVFADSSIMKGGVNSGAISGSWVLPDKGGRIINGRWFTEHALERMAPNTPQVMAQLETRALGRAHTIGLKIGTKEFEKWMLRNGPNPRGIPPSVVEAEIANPGTTGIRVILNQSGNVITVIPGG